MTHLTVQLEIAYWNSNGEVELVFVLRDREDGNVLSLLIKTHDDVVNCPVTDPLYNA